METVETNTPEATKEAAAQFIVELKKEAAGAKHAIVVALSGDLGSGKTTFAQGAAAALGITERVVSPTFVVERIYEIPGGDTFQYLIHIDAYRLEEASELHTLGFTEQAADPRNLILIEWPERVASALPATRKNVACRWVNETTREFAFS